MLLQVFGNSAATRALPVIVSLSALGNVLAVTFANPRGGSFLASYFGPTADRAKS